MLDRLTIERMTARAGEGPFLVALSGGGDSVALLHLLAQHFGAARLRAVVVDHGIRAESHIDAARAADMAARLGVVAGVERVRWHDGENRAHEAAREARYALLADAARRMGATVIATGHTRDDQAETVLLRAARGSGLRGLAAMRGFAPVPIWPEGRGLWLARPLLGARRADLRILLRERGASWIEDPANTNEVYARAGARRTLAALEQGGLDPMRVAAIAEKLAPHADRIDEVAWDAIEASARFEDDRIVVDASGWPFGDEVGLRALAALVIAAGGHHRGPAHAQLKELERRMFEAPLSGATLAGAAISTRRGNYVFTRDRGALEGRADGAPPIAPLALSAGKEVVWDNRVALVAPEAGWSVVVENGAPWLAHGEQRAALAVASPCWLLRERVRHVLGRD